MIAAFFTAYATLFLPPFGVSPVRFCGGFLLPRPAFQAVSPGRHYDALFPACSPGIYFFPFSRAPTWLLFFCVRLFYTTTRWRKASFLVHQQRVPFVFLTLLFPVPPFFIDGTGTETFFLFFIVEYSRGVPPPRRQSRVFSVSRRSFLLEIWS